MMSQVKFIYKAQTHKILPVGFTIYTAYNTLFPQTLDLDKGNLY